MKFCFVAPTFYPYVGGIAHATHELSRHLVQKGHEVTVITRLMGTAIERESLDGIEVYRIKRWLPNLTYLDYIIFSIISFFLLLRLDVEIIHAQSILPFGILTGLAGKIKRRKSVVQAHGKDVNKELVLKWWTRPFSVWALKNNDMVIALCNYHKEIIRKYVDRDVFILPHGMNPIGPRTEKEWSRSEIDLDRSYLNILFAGRLIPRKGADILIEAVKPLNDCYIHFIGEGPEEHKLRELAAKNNMQDRMTFHGFLSREETLKYMIACDLFILPTHKEAFGIVILEAMEMKLPIITSNASDTGGPADILKNEEDALLVPRDYFSLKNAILKLKNDPELAKILAENAFKKVRSEYSWDNVVMNYIEIYKQNDLRG